MNRITPLFLIAASFIILIAAQVKPDATGVFNVNATTREEITEELVIALFMEDIKEQVLSYYTSAKYPEEVVQNLALYNYETKILSIHKSNGIITVKFGITPQLGAHNPAGYEELTYMVNASGKGQLTEYKHVKSFPLP